MAFNKCILVGNLVSDPELKATTNGVNVTRFRIAVGRRFANADAEIKADFFDIVAWRNTAEFVSKFFKKGSPILVSGSLQNRSWSDSDGKKRYATEIVADEVSFVGGKGDNGQPTANEAPSYGIPDGLEELADEDSLPF